MKRKWIERFTGFTINLNPAVNLIALLLLSFKVKGLVSKIKSDRVNLVLWVLMAISGIITVIFAADKYAALGGYLIPFVIIWLYILGRWVIKDPATFIQDLIRGILFLSIIVVVASLFHLEWSIGKVRILHDFSTKGRGEVLYVGNNVLALLIQAGVIGAFGSIFVYWKERRFLFENLMVLIFGAWAIVITGSKGAMAGTVAGLLVFVTSYGIVTVISAGVLTGIWLFFSKRLHVLFFSGVPMSSEWQRMEIWRATLRMIKDHLFFGVGAGQFIEEFQRYRPESMMAAQYDNVCTCGHSNYLSYVASYGIVGGILFFGWQFFVMARAVARGINPLQRMIVAILISFYVHVLVNDLVVAYWGILLGLLENPYFYPNRSVTEPRKDEV